MVRRAVFLHTKQVSTRTFTLFSIYNLLWELHSYFPNLTELLLHNSYIRGVLKYYNKLWTGESPYSIITRVAFERFLFCREYSTMEQ